MRGLARVAALAALALSAACATLTDTSRVTPLPAQAQREPSGFVVVTVRNEPRPYAARPGSTPRGYDSASAYGVSSRAGDTVRSLERAYGLQQVSAWPIATLHVHCIVFRVPAATARASLIAALSRDPRVESAQELNEFTTQSAAVAQTPDSAQWMPYNDPYGRLQHTLRELRVIEAQRRSRGAGVRIAIIDTGVDFDHPDLRSGEIARRNFVDADEKQFRRDRHGLEVAGVIAAVPDNGIGIVGIAPDARLLALKACWQSAGGSRAVCNSFTLAQALEAAIIERVDVVNLSLSGPSDALLERLVRRGLQEGMLFVGAIPPPAIGGGFPTEIPGVIGVQVAEDAPPGDAHLRAPGHDILTLVPEGQYDFASGSSLAAAEVSGVLALLLARHPHLPAAVAQSMLARNSRDIQTPTGPLRCIDACAALSELLEQRSCAASTDARVSGADCPCCRDGCSH